VLAGHLGVDAEIGHRLAAARAHAAVIVSATVRVRVLLHVNVSAGIPEAVRVLPATVNTTIDARDTHAHTCLDFPLYFSLLFHFEVFFFLLGPANLFEIPSARFFFEFAAHFFVRNENRFVADVNGRNTHTPPKTPQVFSLPIRFGEKVLILWSSSSLVYYFYYFNRKMSLERDKVAIEEEERQCDPLQT